MISSMHSLTEVRAFLFSTIELPFGCPAFVTGDVEFISVVVVVGDVVIGESAVEAV